MGRIHRPRVGEVTNKTATADSLVSKGITPTRCISEPSIADVRAIQDLLGGDAGGRECTDTIVSQAYLRIKPRVLPGGVRRGVTVLRWRRSEEHTSELQSLMRISYAVFCLKK